MNNENYNESYDAKSCNFVLPKLSKMNITPIVEDGAPAPFFLPMETIAVPAIIAATCKYSLTV